MEKNQVEFLISEHTSLRSELMMSLRQADTTIFYSLFGNAAIFGWIMTQTQMNITVLLASLLPIIITFLAYIYYRSFISGVIRIATYCKIVEKQLAGEGLGWENFLAERRKNEPPRIKHKVSHAVFFLQFILASYLFIATLLNYLHTKA